MTILTILTNLEEWERDAGSCLEDADKILNFDSNEDQMSSDVAFRIKELVTEMESVIAAGLSLRFDFLELPKLQKIHVRCCTGIPEHFFLWHVVLLLCWYH
ncbi:hypothetical protein Droror1_Dr00018055 [Drosera rotundifolia]